MLKQQGCINHVIKAYGADVVSTNDYSQIFGSWRENEVAGFVVFSQ